MNHKIFRAAALLVSVCALSFAAAGQQPAARSRRGGLDNLSLPSTTARVAAASTGTGAATWLTFAPEGAGFSVSLPGMPEEATQTGRERGQLAAQFRSYRLAAGGLKYEIGRTGQMPQQFVSQPEYVEKFFAGARQGINAALQHENQQIKFRLVSEQTISLDGYEGREYEFDAEGHRAVARLFIIERSLFALSVLGPKSEMTPDRVNKFLDSFALAQ
ncbi:MAG TPA: hypothetical protein VJ842_11165 [Pyrinomonadaceae bacterium]|nr:hypothetical protein [Pyrinomonadaceae bacterium]